MVYVLDTHAVVWFIEGSSRLGAAAKVAMSSTDVRFFEYRNPASTKTIVGITKSAFGLTCW